MQAQSGPSILFVGNSFTYGAGSAVCPPCSKSRLDFDKPGDPAKLVATTRQMTEFLRGRNPRVEIHLMATWSRAGQTYSISGPTTTITPARTATTSRRWSSSAT